MNKLAVLSADELAEIIVRATETGIKRASIGSTVTVGYANGEDPKYYSPAELADKFPFKESTWQGWIRQGRLGRITRSGKLMATYGEAENFLFERNTQQ